MKSIAAIVLLLWAVCYGRCLAEQYGAFEQRAKTQCCSNQSKNVPAPSTSTDGVCEFIQSGSVLPIQSLVLDAPVFLQLLVVDFHYLTLQAILAEAEAEQSVIVNTDPPRSVRLWEWMASTAEPVRGPSLSLA